MVIFQFSQAFLMVKLCISHSLPWYAMFHNAFHRCITIMKCYVFVFSTYCIVLISFSSTENIEVYCNLSLVFLSFLCPLSSFHHWFLSVCQTQTFCLKAAPYCASAMCNGIQHNISCHFQL